MKKLMISLCFMMCLTGCEDKSANIDTKSFINEIEVEEILVETIEVENVEVETWDTIEIQTF